MPSWFLIIGIIISTARRHHCQPGAHQRFVHPDQLKPSSLNFWPKIKINYPTNIKGQMYISSINWMLYFCCFFVCSLFPAILKHGGCLRTLAITITMLMTTILLSIYLYYRRYPDLSRRPVSYVYT